MTLSRIANQLEYRRIPPPLLPAVARALLGVLHIRFSPLWSPAADALAQALQAAPAAAWPLLLGALRGAQAEFLAAGSAARGQAHVPQSQPGPGTRSRLRRLRERFAEAAATGGSSAGGGPAQPAGAAGSSDAAVRLTHLLRALARAPHEAVEAKAREWVPLFLAFADAKGGSGGTGVALERAAGEDDKADDDDDDANDDDDEEEEERVDQGRQQLQTARACGPPAPASAAASERAARRGPGATMHEWRRGLADWLALLAGLRGVRGMWGGEEVQASSGRR